ncbi:Sialidase domain-containing protein [Mycena indigotica]|uniref:Sialidase domain-containing protein n=1 Tax=Mycena indigotica TaxID=2126181 RepID=A0A8H6RY07_9AGAR|nr:Sialidase domain-containing protein [Mycena indigotica]KAF7288973.1 Sialidase domain-containing protein [Mycena indigotica]
MVSSPKLVITQLFLPTHLTASNALRSALPYLYRRSHWSQAIQQNQLGPKPFPLIFAALVTALRPRANGLAPTVDPTRISINPNGGGTYPRLAQLADGSVLGAVTAFSGSTHILTVTRSTDGARTFAAWGTVATGTGDLDNMHLKQLPNGDVLATFRNHDKNAAGAYTFYRITACISHDNGKTWAFLSQVDQRTPTTANNGLWEPFIRVSKSGAIQVYYAAENSASDQDILMRSSTNNGATWSAATTVAGGGTTGRDGMPGCTDLTASGGSARVLCIFETTEGTAPLFTVKSVVSSNDGASFSGRTQVYAPAGHNAGAPQIVTTSAGILVASFMTDEEHSGSSAWPQGASMKILTSDSSLAWGQKTTVLPISSLWPGLYSRLDGSATVVGCADNGGATCRSISFA